jgi:hypothetical protein
MNHRDIVYFSLILFAALLALSHWKARRNRLAGRIKRGLQSYAAGTESLATPLSARDSDGLPESAFN